MSPPAADRMNALEIRAGLSLASLFALRMLGLFLILPVFAVHASGHLSGGDNQTLVGLALGIYGLTQGVLQIPFGMASDRYGRKRVIIIGLVIFAVGSFIAAFATHIWTAIAGRAIQGAGAISAAVVALAADLTREHHRTKVMAMIGASIGLTFALSLMVAPVLYRLIGMDGLFNVVGLLSLAGIAVVHYLVPAIPDAGPSSEDDKQARLADILRDVELLRLNFGIFVLHLVQIAMFVVVPLALVRGGLDVQAHWKVYLPVVLLSFVLMVPPLLMAERRGRIKSLFLASIAAILAVQAGFALWLDSRIGVAMMLTAFFVAFNILEATLPSLVSRIAPASGRGTAIGVYNTTQSLGLAAGGVIGGWLSEHVGDIAVFVFGMALIALWLVFAAGMQAPGRRGGAASAGARLGAK